MAAVSAKRSMTRGLKIKHVMLYPPCFATQTLAFCQQFLKALTNTGEDEAFIEKRFNYSF